MCSSVLSVQRIERASQMKSFPVVYQRERSALLSSIVFASSAGVGLSAAAVEVIYSIYRTRATEGELQRPGGTHLQTPYVCTVVCRGLCVCVERRIPQEGSGMALLSGPRL